jgi:hypothetical protein
MSKKNLARGKIFRTKIAQNGKKKENVPNQWCFCFLFWYLFASQSIPPEDREYKSRGLTGGSLCWREGSPS